MAIIYALADHVTNEIRYIGKTIRTADVRLWQHTSAMRKSLPGSHHLYDWMRSLQERPRVIIIDDVSDEDANAAERRWIASMLAQGTRLTNLTAGGDGFSDPTGEVARRISRTLTGRVQPRSVVAKRKASWRRYFETPEAKENLSRGRRGKKLSDETKAKMSASQSARLREPMKKKHRRRHAASRKAWWAIPENKEMMRAAQLARYERERAKA